MHWEELILTSSEDDPHVQTVKKVLIAENVALCNLQLYASICGKISSGMMHFLFASNNNI